MARMNADCGAWVVELLEVGFGSGVVVQHLSQLVSAGHVAGIDASQVMLEVRPRVSKLRPGYSVSRSNPTSL
jgi:ubiquinone/menaquinone biosynthesis C-methylase UbiE